MNEETRRRLERVAARITDERPVDWELETDDTEAGRRRLRHLRTLERIASVHRDVEAGSTTRQTRSRPDGHQDGPEPTAAGSSWGSLELRNLIGRGAAGSVYRAWDPDLQTEVALKLHDPGAGPLGAQQEARRLARVRHPNVVVVHGAREREGRLGIWMELIRGNTLEHCLRKQGPYGASEAASIGVDVLRALAAVHAAGLVHRDVKAANVMREDGGRVVLMDFSSTVERPRLPYLSDDETFVGTARYMAPEIFAGQPGGKTSDLYSAGVLLYRLVTAGYPIEARTARELRDRHLSGEYVPLRDVRPDLPAEFVRVVEKALAPKPEERYQTAGEMERDLSAATAATASRATRSWRPLALVAATVLLVTLAAIRWLPGAPGALEVDATFFRAFGEQELRLRPGARLEAGDELFLEVRGTRDMWTYVFSEDDAGEMYVLFPLEGCDVANPLPADRTTRLPGTFDRKPGKWTATSSGGREHLFVVASTSPLNELEDEIARAPQASPGTPVHLGAESVRRLGVRRGIGGVALDEAPDSGGGSALARLFREFAERSGDENLWTWSITLENPEG